MTTFVAVILAGCTSGDSNAAAVSAQTIRRHFIDKPAVSHVPTTNAAGATALYYGGPVTPNAKVYVVWWGDPSKINASVTAAKGGIVDFFTGITNSSFMDWLNEYSSNINAQAGSHNGMAGTGQFIGRGNYAGTITLSNIPSGNVTDAQIQSTLDQAFTAGTLPAPDDSAIYAIYFPPGVTISLDGTSSCSGFGAYHMNTTETTRHAAYYLVMPDCGDSFAGWTSVTTHELVEAITDNIPTAANMPDYPQAWNDSMGNEMGDLCESGSSTSGTVTTPTGTFTVQKIWDERTKSCAIFSSDTNDFNVSVSPNSAMVALNAPSTFMVQTAVSAGSAGMLTLSASAPTGVTATVSPTTITAGGTATLTVTATNPAAAAGLQVVVRADATAGATTQTHTAALLLSTTTSAATDMGGAGSADMGHAPGDLGAPADDLGHGSGGGGGSGGGASDDMAATGGTGGGGGTPPGKGCSIGGDASAPTSAGMALMLLALAIAGAALRRRRG